MSDDLDITGAVDGYLGGKGFDPSVPVRQSVAGAIDANPQYEVDLAKAAKATGVSMIAARAAPEEVKRQATIQALDFGKLVNETPSTAAFLLDEDNARKSHDDIGALATFEAAAVKAARYMVSADDKGGFARDLLGGMYYGGSAGAAGVFRAASEFIAPPLDVLEQFPSIGGNPLRRLAEGFGKSAADSSARLKEMAPLDDSVVGGGVSSGVQSLGQNLMTLPLALLPGGEAAVLYGQSAMQGGQSYNKARDKGVGQNTALAYGLSDAVVEYATEKLPLHQLLGDVKAGTPLLKSLAKNAALEIPGEQIATVLQDMNEWAVLNPDKPFKDYLAERPSAAAQTLIATLIGTGGQVSLLHAVQGAADTATGTQRKAEATEQRAQALGELLKLAEASKLRERDPEAFATFAQSLVENNTPNLYVDPRALAKAGVDMAALAQSLPSIATQIDQATATGGDLVIPTGEFLAAAPGQAYLQPLLDHARTATDAMSPAEAKVYMQEHGDKLQAEIERVLSEKQGDEAFAASRDQVRDSFLGQLNDAKRFTPDVNNAYASLLGNFYAVQAARLGIAPTELAQRYPLRVGAESVAGSRVMDQGEPDPTGAIDESTGLPLNSDGTVTVYHHTSAANAAEIRRTGVLRSAGEPDLYFTTTPETNTGYGDTAVPFRVQPSRLLLDDQFPSGRQDFRVETRRADKARRVRFREDGVGALQQSGRLNPSNPHTGPASPEFRTWFGKSKLVDAQGQPMVVYHGTNKDFSAFDPQAEPSTFEDDRGLVFLTSDPVEASGYATGATQMSRAQSDATGANVMPVYVAVQNPFIETINGDDNSATEYLDSNRYLLDYARGEHGHDGLIIHNTTTGERLVVVSRSEQIKSAIGNRGMFDANDPNILHQSAHLDLSNPHTGPAAALLEAGRLRPDLFQYPKSDAHDLQSIAKDKLPGWEVKPETVTQMDGSEKPTGVWDVTPPGSEGVASLYEREGKVWLNVAGLEPGDRGSAVYDLAANYALNNGLKFIGDPAGVSRAAMLRRPENMLSSAVKYGTTDHLELHPDQLSGNNDIPGIDWREGDTLHNVRAMMDATMAANARVAPQSADLSYDLHTDSFIEDSFFGGGPRTVGKDRIQELAENSRGFSGAGSPGDTTLRRNALFKSLVQGVGERTEFLERLHQLGGGARDANGSQLDKSFYQGVGARGQIALADDITKTPSVITLLKGADLSTFLHESGHFFLEVQADLAARIQAQIDAGAGVTEGEREIVDDMNRLLAWFGVKGSPELSALDTWHLMSLDEKRQYHEQFARGFEAYAFEGRAPSLELQSTFQRFRAWLVNTYRELKALNVTLTDEVRSVLDRMVASTTQIQEAEAARSMGALFKTPEQAGMTLDEFKAYHELAVDATQQAIQNLEARGLRDMQWLSNARSRTLKDLQKRADGIRREVERQVRAEVMSQPIYQAWQFLTGKGEAIDTAEPEPKTGNSRALDNGADNLFTAIAKLGGLRREEVAKEWGVDPKDKLESGVFGMPIVRKEGGRSIDGMLERLVEEGYLLPDENGKGDRRDFEDAFDRQRRGEDMFSTWHDYAASQGEQPVQPLPENVFFGKLDTAVLKAMYGTKPEAIWRTLSTRRMTSEAKGIHPDVVAETFGFSSGDELVKALLDAQPPSQVIEGLTDQRMLESHGDLGTPEGLQRATDQAIHNEARGRFMATELAALEKASSVREKAPGRRNTVDVLARAARQTAEMIIARLRVRDIRPGQYAAAEVRAARATEKALAGGKIEEAAAEKRNQLIQSHAARAAYAAQDEVRSAVEYLRRFEKRPKSVDPQYLDQIEALLERFDLNSGTSLKTIDKRKTLMQWVESQHEQGMEPEIPPELLNEAMRQSWRDMTLEQLRGLRDTVKQIEHLGRLKNKLLTAKEQREFALIRDEIAQSIIDHAGDRQADTRTPATTLGRALKAVKDFGAAHIKAATWARVFDGGKDGGPVWEYLIRSANERGDQETTMRGQATAALHEIIQPLFDAGKLHGKGKFFPELKRSLNREQIIAMALNTGNAGNIQRMLGGEGWTLAQVMPALSTLTAAEWHAVQAIWDHFESYRPAIGAKEKRVYGTEPTWVEPQAFSMTTADGKTVDLRGGYYPIKYDPLASNRAEQHNDAEAAKRQLQGAYTSATTRRGFTKSRVEEVSGRPLLYSLAGVYSGVNDVIHDLAWHEWLIDANKILRSDKIDGAIREHYGPAAVRQLKTWVADVAAGEQGLQAELDSALGRLRHGVSVAGLGFNVMSALMQPLGLTQSIVRVGAPWIAKGMTQYIASPIDKTREVNDKSEFMAGRARTRFRELNELRNQVEGQTETRRMISATAYFLMMRCQQMVDTPTWLGAYEKAISEGNAEERSIALADQAVIDAQGGGQTKDLSAIERGSPAQKLFTVFYSFMNTALNAGVAKTMTADTPAKKAKLAVDYAMLYVVPAVLGALLKDALTPGDSGDDDWRKLARKLLGEQLAYLMGLMVVTREFAEAGKTVLGLSEHPRDYSGPAGVRLIADTGTLAKQVQQGEFDVQFRKAAVNLVGDLFALPSAQINRTVTGAQALEEGKTKNPAALLFGYQEPR